MKKIKKIKVSYVMVFVIGIFIARGIYTEIANKKYSVDFSPDATGNHINIEKIDSSTLSNESGKVAIYEIERPTNITDDKEKALKAFGFTDDYSVDENEERFFITEGSKTLEVFKNTGGFNYFDDLLTRPETKIDINTVDNNKLYEKCEDILKVMDIQDISRNSVEPSYITEMGPNNKPLEFGLLGVIFKRVLDGKNVYGADKIMFDINSEGNIASAIITIKNYKKIGDKSVISSKKAINKFKSSKKGYIGTDDLAATDSKINESALCYWVESYNKGSQITKPIYMMKGETLNSEAKNKNISNKLHIMTNAVD
ncbi:hypothetical protein [Clostridium cellulovorans]|uniref:Uncharacterized protein n=1 Tax=Clostridium cellulovorans (strain ATCC 35296 / DSM 3052 / OCM 3 / 743B) TaxID=573061 RepID=D9SPG8_CLOC7|nr:hypothetical protein [Clostridium cellulovorans]ADL50017.1 hypothetical protein Clocel_0233 [Clostridium cellulovorans 743B]